MLPARLARQYFMHRAKRNFAGNLRSHAEVSRADTKRGFFNQLLRIAIFQHAPVSHFLRIIQCGSLISRTSLTLHPPGSERRGIPPTLTQDLHKNLALMAVPTPGKVAILDL